MKYVLLIIMIIAIALEADCCHEIGNECNSANGVIIGSDSSDLDTDEQVRIDSVYVDLNSSTLESTLKKLFEETDCVKVTLQRNDKAYEYTPFSDTNNNYDVAPGYYYVIGEHEDGTIEDMSDYLYLIREDYQ